MLKTFGPNNFPPPLRSLLSVEACEAFSQTINKGSGHSNQFAWWDPGTGDGGFLVRVQVAPGIGTVVAWAVDAPLTQSEAIAVLAGEAPRPGLKRQATMQ